MSDLEGFLTRWSRRKRETDEPEPAPLQQTGEGRENPPIPPPLAGEGREGAGEGQAEAPFDPASLPPIDSITAETDLRAFFAPGVPGDLLHAALRRAWSSDPRIRDFVGLSENAWDFNAGAIPGFSSFDAADGIGQVAAKAIDEAGRAIEGLEAPSAEAPAQPPASTRLSDTAAGGDKISEQVGEQNRLDQASETKEEAGKKAAGEDTTELAEVDIASRHKIVAPQYQPVPIRRSHGGALPE